MIKSSWVEDQKELANVIAALTNLRKARGITQDQLAKKIGTTQGIVSTIEIMRYNIRLFTLMAYARALGKRVKIVLEDIDEQS